MLILIDYDNIDALMRRRGLRWLADRVLDRLAPKLLDSAPSASIRLYGGWFLGTQATSLAQTLGAEIQRDFPCVVGVSRGGRNLKVRTMMELALSMQIEPRTNLFSTYRPREWPTRIACRDPRTEGCQQAVCSLDAMHQFITRKACPMTGCTISPGSLLFKGEQKLVDSMLVADIFHAVRTGTQCLAVVSSDDDFWPGIRTALLMGCAVVQIHTLSGRRTPTHYCGGAGSSYEQEAL